MLSSKARRWSPPRSLATQPLRNRNSEHTSNIPIKARIEVSAKTTLQKTSVRRHRKNRYTPPNESAKGKGNAEDQTPEKDSIQAVTNIRCEPSGPGPNHCVALQVPEPKADGW